MRKWASSGFLYVQSSTCLDLQHSVYGIEVGIEVTVRTDYCRRSLASKGWINMVKKRKGKEKVTLEDCPHVIWQWSDLVILSLGHVLIRGRKYLANVSPINRLQFTLLDHNPRAFLKSFTLYANSLYLHLIPHLDIESMPWSSESIPGIQSLTVPHHICLLAQRSLRLRKHKLVGCFRLVCPAPNVFGTRIWILEHRSCDMLSLIFRAILSES